MRMPNSKQISEEQSDIYEDAPLDGAILVTGPPGTGKTVIAFLRAQTIANLEGEPVVSMYNKVLSRYTKNVADNAFEVKTFHSWVHQWWKNLKIPDNHQVERTNDNGPSNVYLNCPFKEKDQAKKLGAKFDGRKKRWYVTPEIYRKNEKAFERWMGASKGTMAIPTLPGNEWQHNWDEIFSIIYKEINDENIKKENVDWGHLIIDEAQDFPSKMFGTFEMLMKLVFSDYEKDDCPALTVFADENQRLKEVFNSTIDDIVSKLMLPEDRVYSLTTNYRNTLQIAKFARTFYCGLRTGRPNLPEREGEVPELVMGKSLNDSVRYIEIFIGNHDDLEIGIITQSESVRKKYFNKLKHQLSNNSQINVQSYSSTDPNHKDVNELNFDHGGVITIVNKQSCKGLEFDAVFLPELQSISVDPSDIDQFKMEMYVMASRARDTLVLMVSNEGDDEPSVLSYLSDNDSGLLRHRNI
jgi:DNA helicase II / ATP-dependent DNA helicase PcrA